MTGSESTGQALLRDDILASGRDDWVSMADVQGRISRRRLAESAPERQQLILRTIRMLLQDGLIEVGDIPAPDDPGFLVWPGTVEEVVDRLTERIVDHYDDPDSWEYSIWLNLTADGERASADVVRARSADQ